MERKRDGETEGEGEKEGEVRGGDDRHSPMELASANPCADSSHLGLRVLNEVGEIHCILSPTPP